MKVTVRTVDTLSHYLPGDDDEAIISIDGGASPHDVLRKLGISTEFGYLIIVNDTVVPKAARETLALAENDQMSILQPLKGG